MSLDFTPPSLTAVVAKVREIASDKPDYVHHGRCRYVVDGAGACIVGRALVELGVPAEFFTPALNSDTINGRIPELFGWPYADELVWLRCVQDLQDAEIPWGRAVNAADAQVPVPAATAASGA